VKWNPEKRLHEEVSLTDVVQSFVEANQSEYVVLSNPAEGGSKEEHPPEGAANKLPSLENGRMVNIPGPISFALWPTQVATTIPGHELRFNQYLVLQVVDADAAESNWDKIVVKPQMETSTVDGGESEEGSSEAPKHTPLTEGASGALERPTSFAVGQRIIVRGDQVSFIIPPTGLHAVNDDKDNNYVRDAVTLEDLEHCTLIDENGTRRYEHGPMVVLPRPTETFVKDPRTEEPKSTAIPLTKISGVYVQVISDYKEGDRTVKAGEELFLTGNNQPFYFPRKEHRILTYGDQEVHHAVAIPNAGEGRYVLGRLEGPVDLMRGPKMFLPDPRTHVIIRRVLSDNQIELMYPGNVQEVLAVNRQLRSLLKGKLENAHLESAEVLNTYTDAFRGGEESEWRGGEHSERLAQGIQSSERMARGMEHTPLREIILDTKYDGAVKVEPWPSYAILVVNAKGDRRVEVGPKPVLLEYDESLAELGFSKGTPKSTGNGLIRTVYLKIDGNTVSDELMVETRDRVKVRFMISYRVNFVGDTAEEQEKWFAVANYTQFLADHMRSMIGAIARQHTIESFYQNAPAILRDAVLGEHVDGENRRGYTFRENNMKVYDLVIPPEKLIIDEGSVANLLRAAMENSVRQSIEIGEKESELDFVQRREDFERKIVGELDVTDRAKHDIGLAVAQRELELNLKRVKREVDVETAQLTARREKQKDLDEVNTAEIARQQACDKQEIATQRERSGIEIEAVTKRLEAIQPDLIAALQAFGNKELAAKALESMAPMALLGGSSVADVVNRMLTGTPFEGIFKTLKPLESQQTE